MIHINAIEQVAIIQCRNNWDILMMFQCADIANKIKKLQLVFKNKLQILYFQTYFGKITNKN